MVDKSEVEDDKKTSKENKIKAKKTVPLLTSVLKMDMKNNDAEKSSKKNQSTDSNDNKNSEESNENKKSSAKNPGKKEEVKVEVFDIESYQEPKEFDKYYEKGLNNLKNGNYTRAVMNFKLALENDPFNKKGHNKLIEALKAERENQTEDSGSESESVEKIKKEQKKSKVDKPPKGDVAFLSEEKSKSDGESKESADVIEKDDFGLLYDTRGFIDNSNFTQRLIKRGLIYWNDIFK
ncbi:MAG: hypothetical protein JSV49_04150 [Thermoplasmata archaeon]|nr:MAG: hypothetical protein JSV49_04150 [Thermoplasmata archaeon]